MKHIKRLAVVLIMVVGVLVYFNAFKLAKAKAITNENLIEYSKDGFVAAKNLTNTSKLVGENANLKLYLDETTSYFWVEDKVTGEIIRSNPNVKDPREKLTVNVDLDSMSASTVTLTYNIAQHKFNLPSKLSSGSTITWSSSDETVITSDFELITPLDDTEVILTGILSADGETAKIEYTISVTSAEIGRAHV